MYKISIEHICISSNIFIHGKLTCVIIDIKHLNPLKPRQNGWHFPDNIFKSIFLNENIWISIIISLKFVPKNPINNMTALIEMMVWRRSGNKSLSEPMMVSLLTHICVTRHHWQLDCPTVCWGWHQENIKDQYYWPFVRGIHQLLVDSPHKGPVMQKVFPLSWQHHEVFRYNRCPRTITRLARYHSYHFYSKDNPYFTHVVSNVAQIYWTVW